MKTFLSLIALLTLRSKLVVADDGEYVTCGSAIKLSHSERSGEKYFLSSDGHRTNSGSGQQLVTASPTSSSSGNNALWIISAGHGMEPCVTGDKIAFGSRIRLTHLDTGGNLHSHHVRSPLSNQQEVTAFGENGEGDNGDDWVVNPTRSRDNFWLRGQEVVLQHHETQKYLGCSEQARFTRGNCGRNCPVMNHLEIFGRKEKDAFVTWQSDVGIFLQK